MTSLNTSQVVAALNASGQRVQVRGDVRESACWPRVVIDSREVEAGDVFWALPGTQQDGANFITDAWQRGAIGVVTDRYDVLPAAGRWALVVPQVQRGLEQLARAQRDRFTGRVVAVTGSVGKTTTRQMIAAVLGQALAGSASPRNYNTPTGTALSLTAWNPQDDYAVVELAARRAGEIASLAAMVRPQVGVITRIGEAHLATFGDRATIARTKGELLDWLPADGYAVLNADDNMLRRVVGRRTNNALWVGRSADADFCATDIESANGSLRFTVEGQRLTVPVWGRHQVTSALAAVAIARAIFGIDWFTIAAGLKQFRAPPMRCEVSRLRGATVINDCYNANPVSLRAALDLLREVETTGRRIAVCGDMRELGAEASQMHREVGEAVVNISGADFLVAVGRHAAELAAGAVAAGMPARHVFVCESAVEAGQTVDQLLRPTDVVLFKASRAVALERALDWLSDHEPQRLRAA